MQHFPVSCKVLQAFHVDSWDVAAANAAVDSLVEDAPGNVTFRAAHKESTADRWD